ncbi:unnamed protein product [Choristocarpus tenellus]
MKGQRNPHIAYHGSLSCMVNLDALSRYTHFRGGFSMCSPFMEGFKCQALVFGMGEDSLEVREFLLCQKHEVVMKHEAVQSMKNEG